MQLLGHVVFYVSIKLHTMHGIGIILEGGGAVLTCTGMPRGNDAPGEGTLVVGSGTVVMGVVSGKAPAANLPQGAVIFIMVGGLLVAFETVREWGRGVRTLALVHG